MDLDKVLTLKVRKLKQKRNWKPSKEQIAHRNARYIVRVIQRGEYNPDYKQHKIMLNTAQKLGYVNKKMEILREG